MSPCYEEAPPHLSFLASSDPERPLGRAYADRVGGANGDLNLHELIAGRSYELQCRSYCQTVHGNLKIVWAGVY